MSGKVHNKLLQKSSRLRALGPLTPDFSFGFQVARVKPGEKSLSLPFKRSPQLIAVSAAFLAAFSIPLFIVGSSLPGSGSDSLFNLVSLLFSAFWLLGWSVGVFILLAVFLALVAGRETLYLQPGLAWIRVEVLGLGVGVAYKSQGIKELRWEAASQSDGHSWRGSHLAFDYGGETIRFGSTVEAQRGQQVINAIEQITMTRDAVVQPLKMNHDLKASAQTTLPPSNSIGGASVDPVGLTSISTMALIVANLVPLFGVILWNWQIGEIMLLFWAESAIIGFYNLLKMWIIGRWSVLFLGPFFLGHYGGFMAGHLLFIYALFLSGMGAADPSVGEVLGDFISLWPALLALLVSHGVSYQNNFLAKGEYLSRSIKQQMSEPYKRIIIMHVTIIFGGFLIMAFDTPLLALWLLITLKIIVDVKSHLREHGKQNASVTE